MKRPELERSPFLLEEPSASGLSLLKAHQRLSLLEGSGGGLIGRPHLSPMPTWNAMRPEYDGLDEIARRPPWNFRTTSMDNFQDGKLRCDPTDQHQWCTSFPCGVTAPGQERKRGQELKPMGTTKARYSREQQSLAMQGSVRVVAEQKRLVFSQPPPASVHGSVRAKHLRSGDDWMHKVSGRAHIADKHIGSTNYRLRDGRITPIASPRRLQTAVGHRKAMVGDSSTRTRNATVHV